MAHVNFSDLRRNLATHLDRVENDRVELVVTRQNHEDMVIVPLAEWEGLHETMRILSSPLNARLLRESIAELEAGGGTEHDLIEP